jgi:menaquinone-dependent protoporphyrinogen oxidase
MAARRRTVSMSSDILVAYATHTGSTADVAAAIGDTLRTRGFTVSVAPVTDDPSPVGYRAVVIGSAINGGQWLPAARQYVERHLADLRRVPVAVFSVHIMNAGDTERAHRKRLAYLDAIRPSLQTVDEAFLIGMGPDPARDPWLSRWLFRRFGGAGEGDCRDWDKIRVWATSVLANQLQPV